jgi:ubiquinone/menaquinone biosynthesis C-methylase UbiE
VHNPTNNLSSIDPVIEVRALVSREERFQRQKDRIKKHFLKYLCRAFRMLPQLDKPRILDIGCGSGIPTLELARLGRGEVVGIDIDQPALDKFIRRIEEARLTNRVQAINCSMFNMGFPDGSFNIIWSEGSIYAIGFERGLREWKRFLKPGGYMVIHDEQGNIGNKIEQISKCGYYLRGYFILSKETWWTEFFAPLERLIGESQTRYTNGPKVLEEFQQAQVELDMFKQDPEHNSSIYFIIKREATINERACF